jgi:predicted DNA-binding protein with PD1-like motif
MSRDAAGKSACATGLCHTFNMRRSIVLAVAFLSLAAAQETRREITNNAPTPAADAKANSDQVPDVYAVSSQFQRVLIFRFKYQADLLAGLQQMVKENKIRNAVILAGAGSVRGYQVHQVSNRTMPSKNMFVKDPTAPADMIGMNGYIMNGKIHAHVTLANPDKAFGGHLEPGTEVFTFAIVTVGVLPDDLDLTKLDDKTYR